MKYQTKKTVMVKKVGEIKTPEETVMKTLKLIKVGLSPSKKNSFYLLQ